MILTSEAGGDFFIAEGWQAHTDFQPIASQSLGEVFSLPVFLVCDWDFLFD
jgi:hypothetical protein